MSDHSQCREFKNTAVHMHVCAALCPHGLEPQNWYSVTGDSAEDERRYQSIMAELDQRTCGDPDHDSLLRKRSERLSAKAELT